MEVVLNRRSETPVENLQAMRSSTFLAALTLAVVSLITMRGQLAAGPKPEDHRAEIRAALLKSTPTGAKPADVLSFISKSLLKAGAHAPRLENQPAQIATPVASTKKGVKRIRYFLGSYLDKPALLFFSAPLILEKEVSVQWAFDKDERLIDIFVDKKTATY